jgi:hypothetical protein
MNVTEIPYRQAGLERSIRKQEKVKQRAFTGYSYVDYQDSLFLVWDWDHDRNDRHLAYLAGHIWTVDDRRPAGFICHVSIGAPMGAGYF